MINTAKMSGWPTFFVRSEDGNWSQQVKLTASDGVAHDEFGVSVSVSGNTALIRAWYDDDKGENSGSAYVFVRSSDGAWNQTAKLTALDGAAGDRFGHPVSLDGTTALIGAYMDDDKGNDSGSAYIFVRGKDGKWMQQQKLTADDGAAGDKNLSQNKLE